jgi:hypothetical protein
MIKNTHLTRNVFIPQTHFTNTFESQKNNYFSYHVTINDSLAKTIILNQSFHSGWQAYKVSKNSLLSSILPFLFNKGLAEHVVINNWANGWNIDQSKDQSSITLLFVPQYLEYLGLFLIIILVPCFILFKKKPSHLPIHND